MSTLGEAYIAQKLAETQTAAARAARVKEFIADSNPEIISDLFELIKDAVIEREAEAVLSLTKHYLSVKTALNELEAGLYIR